MNAVITGAGGMLATDLLRRLQDRDDEVTLLDRARLDITDRGAVASVLWAPIAKLPPGIRTSTMPLSSVSTSRSSAPRSGSSPDSTCQNSHSPDSGSGPRGTSPIWGSSRRSG